MQQGIRREMRTKLAQCGLSVQEYTALSVLGARPGLSNAQLAHQLAGDEPQSISKSCSRLERRELVAREPDPAERQDPARHADQEGRWHCSEDADRAVAGIQERIHADVPQRERATK